MLSVKVFFRSTAGGVEYKKIYDGKMQVSEGKTVICYDEIDDNGLTKTEVCIVDGDFVTVKRTGQFSNYLEFKNGHSYSGEYLTPYGKIPVEAYTRKLTVLEKNGVLLVDAQYKSSLMGEESENEFSIKVGRAKCE